MKQETVDREQKINMKNRFLDFILTTDYCLLSTKFWSVDYV
jgi:hypothetical protein